MSDFKILAVDDSPTMRADLINKLGLIGYTGVVEACNGKDALDKLKTKTIDFIITDWDMPKMNGLDLTLAIRDSEEWKDLPILMITVPSANYIASAIEAGITDYIVKPFTSDTLKEKIEQILEESKT